MTALRIWLALPFLLIGVALFWIAELIAGNQNATDVRIGVGDRLAARKKQ